MDHQQFCQAYGENVSRETFDKLSLYVELLKKWQPKINLVSPKTVEEVWSRHILDSAQTYPFIKETHGNDTSLADFGSGAGFPGLILAVLGFQNVQLVESDQRKTVFLREVARQCDLPVTIHNKRIEDAELQNISCITARALSSLDQLFTYASPVIKQGGECYFLKGASVDQEIEDAQKNWKFTFEKRLSLTEKDACILRVSDLNEAAQ